METVKTVLLLVCVSYWWGVTAEELEPALPDTSPDASLRYPQNSIWELGKSSLRSLLPRLHSRHADVRANRPKKRVKNHMKVVLKIKQKVSDFRFRKFLYYLIEFLMFYVDTERTLTRRESSLVTPRRADDEYTYTNRGQSTNRLTSGSEVSLHTRKGSAQKDVVAQLFESMLGTIVESWTVIEEPKLNISTNTPSNAESITKDRKKKKIPSAGGVSDKATKSKANSSKEDLSEIPHPLEQTWRPPPDERAIIRFRNGNVYEGSISMKCMNGSGRFQWANGAVYMGQFKDNVASGKGRVEWSDGSWYEGEFSNHNPHGYGIHVDHQLCYIGDWCCGDRHGQGVIYYDHTFRNSYDGRWDHNLRHGYGIREYNQLSGYKGHWNRGVKQGQGLMIWPNHDVYKGHWDNDVMSGAGVYTWEACHNDTLTLPSETTYRGCWRNGEKHGHGQLDLGLGGAVYKGEFINNKKHGAGILVTNNGLILQDKELFNNNNFNIIEKTPGKLTGITEPRAFDFCDYTTGLLYHVEQAVHDILNVREARAIIIRDYLHNNATPIKCNLTDNDAIGRGKSIMQSELESLKKALLCFQKELLNTYHQYANICHNDKVDFSPLLIRLFLWQLYYDCNIIKSGLTLVEVDKMLHKNPDWLSRSPHDPFEKIYFWQFVHSLINVATKLYLPKCVPAGEPDSMLGKAFRTFMENDLLPNTAHHKGKLVNGYGKVMPLRAMYALYRELGEPLSVRAFLRAVRHPAHWGGTRPPLVGEDTAPCLRNIYVIGDEINYVAVESSVQIIENCGNKKYGLKLFNFGNLSSKCIIKQIFTQIFPTIYTTSSKTIVNVDVKMTFYEFFEAFVLCAEESCEKEIL